MTAVVVAGIPGSGKTTLARRLGTELDVSVISKDVIKESLFDTLGSGDNQWSKTLSRSAHRIMYDLVADMAGPIILEAHFYPGLAETELADLGRPLIQVYCRCPVDVAWNRYRRRRDDAARHPGHRADHQNDEATRRWRTGEPRPLDLDAPLIEVDTSARVDIETVCSAVDALLAR